MFKTGDKVTVSAMGDNKPATVIADSQKFSSSTRVEIEYNDVTRGASTIKMNISNNLITRR